jgi:deazaflavin-dependent oxidoreductase (nitroreductase family)
VHHRSIDILGASMARPTKLRYVDPRARRGPIYRAVARFSVTRPAGWLAVHLAWKVDPFLLRLSRGRISLTAPLAAGLLETRGARTGLARRNATLYFHDGDRVTIIASLRGRPKHPDWYHNLRAHPDVVFAGLPFRAVVITDEDERRRLWELADMVYPAYPHFRQEAARAGRQIPIVQLVAPARAPK